MDLLLSVLALTAVGTLVGVELMVAAIATPIFSRLPGETALLARADSARVMGRLMPWWYIGSIVMTTLSAVTSSGTARVTAAAADGLLILGIVLSVLLLVPINNRVRSWDRAGGGAPDDWREQLGTWDRLHVGRVGVILVGFVLLAVSAGL